MKYSLGICHFLEEISSLSHSGVFIYFFALITEELFLISPCYSLELCIQMDISFIFSFVFASLLFTAICKASSGSHFAYLHFFPGGWLIPVSCIMSLSYQWVKYLDNLNLNFLNFGVITLICNIVLNEQNQVKILKIWRIICAQCMLANYDSSH